MNTSSGKYLTSNIAWPRSLFLTSYGIKRQRISALHEDPRGDADRRTFKSTSPEFFFTTLLRMKRYGGMYFFLGLCHSFGHDGTRVFL